ncbi:SRPBCC family protein [Jatrophihabitans sp.]|uniref:SRPBCC family protein n=1 Tax=Jatrophihabitans sp. TaxID=1932789 RepID=UPI0030C76DE1|nr:Polyketide cyclase/dehydrase [Jatrophihabitans sp.]
MPRPMTVAESVVINVDPEVVYAAISDPTQTPRWSPENRGAVLDVPGTLTVGSTFVGRNVRRGFRWHTRCRVTAAEPGRRFAFRVEAIGVKTPRLKGLIATWEYDLSPSGQGTLVTETWTDGRKRWPDVAAKAFDKVATRSTFHEFNRNNIKTTLANLKVALEAS